MAAMDFLMRNLLGSLGLNADQVLQSIQGFAETAMHVQAQVNRLEDQLAAMKHQLDRIEMTLTGQVNGAPVLLIPTAPEDLHDE